MLSCSPRLFHFDVVQKLQSFDFKVLIVPFHYLHPLFFGNLGTALLLYHHTRNFEIGVLSSNRDFVKNAAEQFGSVWMGAYFKATKEKCSTGTRLK